MQRPDRDGNGLTRALNRLLTRRLLASLLCLCTLPLGAATLLLGSLAGAAAVDTPAAFIALGALSAAIVVFLLMRLALKLSGRAAGARLAAAGSATLGATYMANNPQHVAAAVFSGPGPIYHPPWTKSGYGGLDERMSERQRAAFSAMIEKPRLFAALALASINQHAAVRFAGERELGSLFDKVANEFYLPLAVCGPAVINANSSGYGFWSNRMTSQTLRAPREDPRPELRANETPVLILRGACDYVREQAASPDYS